MVKCAEEPGYLRSLAAGQGRRPGGGGHLGGGAKAERMELRELLGDTEVAFSIYNLFLCLEGSTLQEVKGRAEEQVLG